MTNEPNSLHARSASREVRLLLLRMLLVLCVVLAIALRRSAGTGAVALSPVRADPYSSSDEDDAADVLRVYDIGNLVEDTYRWQHQLAATGTFAASPPASLPSSLDAPTLPELREGAHEMFKVLAEDWNQPYVPGHQQNDWSIPSTGDAYWLGHMLVIRGNQETQRKAQAFLEEIKQFQAEREARGGTAP